jgi:hypothetical protein
MSREDTVVRAKLKPCPFCKKPVEMRTYHRLGYWIIHPDRNSERIGCGIAFDVTGYHGGVKEKKALIKAWNKRWKT